MNAGSDIARGAVVSGTVATVAPDQITVMCLYQAKQALSVCWREFVTYFPYQIRAGRAVIRF